MNICSTTRTRVEAQNWASNHGSRCCRCRHEARNICDFNLGVCSGGLDPEQLNDLTLNKTFWWEQKPVDGVIDHRGSSPRVDQEVEPRTIVGRGMSYEPLSYSPRVGLKWIESNARVLVGVRAMLRKTVSFNPSSQQERPKLLAQVQSVRVGGFPERPVGNLLTVIKRTLDRSSASEVAVRRWRCLLVRSSGRVSL